MQVDDLQTTIEDEIKCTGEEAKILAEDSKGIVIERPSNEVEKCIGNNGLAASMQFE